MVKVEDELGNITTASSTGSDIVMVSADAMISGINEIMLRKQRSASQTPRIETP